MADDYSEVTQLLRAGKLPEALSRADQFLSSQPKDAQMRFLKGVIQRDSGKQSDAISTFTRLTEDYPDLPEPYNNLAVLYASQGQFDKARVALEMAIRTNPSYATAHENLGDVYAKLASQAYNKALQLDNSNPAVPPKLALIRELFTSTSGSAKRPGPGVATATASPATPAQAPAATSPAKAPPTLPAAPVAAATKPAPAPAAAPAPTTPAAPVATSTSTAVAATNVPPKAAVASASPATAPAPASAASSAEKEVENAIKGWASAWTARDVKGYLAAYGKDFSTPGGISRSAWEDERRKRIAGKSNISVKINNLQISINAGRASAKFKQDYRASGLSVSSRKTLDLVKTGDRWLITRESVAN